MKKLLVLGVSGSIGTQTIDVIKEHLDEFELVGCSVYSNIAYARQLLQEFNLAYIGLKEANPILEHEFPDTKFYYGEEGLCEMAKLGDYDLLINALVGINGLLPTLTAMMAKKDVALANKETLVIAGDIVNKVAKANGVKIYPIDSEHSAIYQCLNGERREDIKRLIITASGGAFRHLKHDELANVTLQEALHHPTWKMGKKVTIDSATMMNKGFEVIEAHYLFDIAFDNISVLQHRESVIHSMVEFKDHSVMAQLSNPDMRIAIQYALTSPCRIANNLTPSLKLEELGSLNFSKLNFERYPLLALAYEVGRKGGNLGAILNAADEEAINLFSEGKISFLDIENVVKDTIANAVYIKDASLEERFNADRWAREYVKLKWSC